MNSQYGGTDSRRRAVRAPGWLWLAAAVAVAEVGWLPRRFDAIVQGKRRKCDVMRLVHREGEIYSINLVSVGFAADAAVRFNSGLGVAVVSLEQPLRRHDGPGGQRDEPVPGLPRRRMARSHRVNDRCQGM